MSLSVIFQRAAKLEFLEASMWYESKRLGLGAEFIEEIERCISRAAEFPSLYKVVHNDLRCVIANRFPYAIYFRQESQHIVILAVFHSSRNPRSWQSRI